MLAEWACRGKMVGMDIEQLSEETIAAALTRQRQEYREGIIRREQRLRLVLGIISGRITILAPDHDVLLGGNSAQSVRERAEEVLIDMLL
jgi:hypothetical protein